MTQLRYVIRLIRALNLVFIVLTQYLLMYAVVKPVLQLAGMQPVLDHTGLILLVFSTALTAAAGYVINDYFDVKIDALNRPAQTIVGRTVSRRMAILIHSMLNIAGVILGLLAATRVGIWFLGLVPMAVSLLLWFYSSWLKHKPLWGNILVSSLTALVVLIVGAYELMGQSLPARELRILKAYFWIIAGFAFWISLVRELVKDLEDIHGDELAGSRTFPVVYGIRKAKYLVIVLSMVMFVAIAYFSSILFDPGQWEILLYVGLAVELPMALMMAVIFRAQTQQDFHRASGLLKIVMLGGILAMGIVHILAGPPNWI